MDFDAIPKHIYSLINRVEAIEAVLAAELSAAVSEPKAAEQATQDALDETPVPDAATPLETPPVAESVPADPAPETPVDPTEAETADILAEKPETAVADPVPAA